MLPKPEGKAKVSGAFLILANIAQNCFDLAVMESGLSAARQHKLQREIGLLAQKIQEFHGSLHEEVESIRDRLPSKEEMGKLLKQAAAFGDMMVAPQMDHYEDYPLKVNTRLPDDMEKGLPCGDPDCDRCA
jgi:ABC-type multidrug transport system fused ATPase/permease subunit